MTRWKIFSVYLAKHIEDKSNLWIECGFSNIKAGCIYRVAQKSLSTAIYRVAQKSLSTAGSMLNVKFQSTICATLCTNPLYFKTLKHKGYDTCVEPRTAGSKTRGVVCHWSQGSWFHIPLEA